MRIRKVKMTKAGRIQISYEKKNRKGDWDEYSLSSSEAATPGFHDALAALRADVVEMCELPVEYEERISVTGVSVSISEDREIPGATITAQLRLDKSHAPLNLNTPHKAEEMYAEDAPEDKKSLLSGECIDALHALYHEAERYVKGERAQGDLFANVPEERDEPDTGAVESVTLWYRGRETVLTEQTARNAEAALKEAV